MSDKQNSDLTIGVLSPNLGGFYFGDIMTALHRHARTAGMCLLSIRAGQRSPVSLPLAHELVDGWIIVPGCLTPIQLDLLIADGKPVVSIERDAGHPGASTGQDTDRQASLAIGMLRSQLGERGERVVPDHSGTASGHAGFGDADHAAAIGFELSKDLIGADAGKVLERMRLLAPSLEWACIGQWSNFAAHTDRLTIDHVLDLKNAGSDSPGLLGSEIAISAFPPPPGRPGAGRFTTVVPILLAHKWTVLAVTGIQRSDEDVARYPMLMHYIDLLSQAMERSLTDEETRASAERLRTQSLEQSKASLIEMNEKLSLAHEQLVQSEKLASIGQLAAGVAHEINNPIGYISSNFGTLEGYLEDVFEVLDAYREAEPLIGAPAAKRLSALRGELELDMLKEDIPALMGECKEGISRVRKIVEDLKNFSRSDDQDEWQWADLHKGIDSTLNVINNEIKFKADVVRNYGVLPNVECLPSQINQVVMNLVINAVHAFKEERGRIVISTGALDEQVWIEVADNGCGIPQKNLMRIFDPFFTTKPIGKGTGLGLSISYGIIQRHNGQITVHSEIDKGTTFRIALPIDHAAAP